MSGDDGEPPRARPRLDRAAMASNWRQVLVVDAVLGGVVVVAGLLVGVLWIPAVGVPVAVVGLAYVALGLSRWQRWARLHEAVAGNEAEPVDE